MDSVGTSVDSVAARMNSSVLSPSAAFYQPLVGFSDITSSVLQWYMPNRFCIPGALPHLRKMQRPAAWGVDLSPFSAIFLMADHWSYLFHFISFFWQSPVLRMLPPPLLCMATLVRTKWHSEVIDLGPGAVNHSLGLLLSVHRADGCPVTQYLPV